MILVFLLILWDIIVILVYCCILEEKDYRLRKDREYVDSLMVISFCYNVCWVVRMWFLGKKFVGIMKMLLLGLGWDIMLFVY